MEKKVCRENGRISDRDGRKFNGVVCSQQIKKKKENAAVSALQENDKVATPRTIKLAEITGNSSVAPVWQNELETDAQSQT